VYRFRAPGQQVHLTHHFRVLREAGIIEQHYQGTAILNTLRSEVLDALSPGLLDAVIHAECGVAGRTDLH
jgi:DNA-binding transcriptional ArsR family regulator